jgi:hypothetical protein
MRTDAIALLAGGGLTDFCHRVTHVALPLVVLVETGSVAVTGLVAGATAVPVLLSPWWARRARQWVDSGRRLAVVSVLVALGLAIVPAAAMADMLNPVALVSAGLLIGFGDALSKPARSALLADAGDRLGRDKAVVLLTWQDLFDRIAVISGPPLATVALAFGLGAELLWAEVIAVLLSGALAVRVPAARPPEGAPSIRSGLTSRREVLRGWIVRGTGCGTWFAYTLGLSVIGAERGRPGVYLAAGMTGYGIGALAGSTVTVALIRRVPAVVAICVAWTVVGLCWTAIGLATTLPVVAVAGAIAGVVVQVGNAAVSAIIVRSSSGPERRALLSGQGVVVSASYAAGMLVGGPVIAAAGAENTLIAAGVLTAVVALAVLQRDLGQRQGSGVGVEDGGGTERDREVVGLVTDGGAVDHRDSERDESLDEHVGERRLVVGVAERAEDDARDTVEPTRSK